ncbi:HAD family acid phosphatase [Halomonas icarae]|uniref:phosphatase domain-containing protein n=1 Tax=Halomonas icarae TaxID=2691040 RepID=UPI001F19B12F|nr:HAD family acid phosphatase [Halomonas icarae]MDR5903416.1 polynucleotide kinase [Halomonas icarae]
MTAKISSSPLDQQHATTLSNEHWGSSQGATDAVIVDVDGTLAELDTETVAPWVLGAEKHWDPFFQHMAKAPVIEPVVRLVNLLKAQGQRILICSGRPASHAAHTRDWLVANAIPFDALYLRPAGDDEVADEEVKAKLLECMREDGHRPWLVIDDRDAVVAGWRRLGLTCLQCADGDF